MGNCPLRPSSLLQWPGEEAGNPPRFPTCFSPANVQYYLLHYELQWWAQQWTQWVFPSHPGPEDLRKWRFCSSTYFLSYSALLTSFSCPWNNETFCKKDNKDQFDGQHEVCFCLTASAVASSKESKAAKSCLCLWITAALFTCPLYRSSLAAGRTRTFPSGLFGSVGTLRKNKSDKSWSLITLSVMFSICVRAVIGVFPVSVWCDTWSFSSPWKHRLCLW